ncbi:MAG TPA: CocE/NonD family hydrolase, partial [Motilibacteraceae bacterium]|nr:CocE/NonD family hydrolase [Motilibacteraceae bacterium]
FFDEVMRFYDKYLRGTQPSVTDPTFAIEDNFGHWRAQSAWPEISTSYDARLTDGRYVDDGGASSSTAAAATASPTARGHWDMERAPKILPLTRGEKHAAKQGAAAGSDYWTWSTPAPRTLRLTATPHVSFDASAPGNVMVRLWDVAPDGTATMFDENVALIRHSGPVSFDLKATDWTFQPRHQLGVQIGTIESRGWRDVPSGNTIRVTHARLGLDVQDPRGDVPTQGDRSPYLDRYLEAYTTTLTDVGRPSFPLRVSHGG